MAWEHTRRAILRFLSSSTGLGPLVLAVVVGLLGGVGAIVFRHLIALAGEAFFGGGSLVLGFLGPDLHVILVPAVGLLLVSAIVRRWAPEAQGHGVPEVMYAIRREGGRIRPRVAVIKALASALCIGSGGSVGREGPIVQIGCTIGSTVGQRLRLGSQRIRLLLACGAAAGIAGTFNAPIAGVIFALEVILGSFAARSFGFVVVSSVTSTAICQAAEGADHAFSLTEVFALNSFFELPVYVLLGLLAGLLAVGIVRTLYGIEGVFDRWTWHPALKAVAGGLAVGGIGYLGIRLLGGPYLFGVGYDGIDAVLDLSHESRDSWMSAAGPTILVLLSLCALKIVAMSVTLAAGGSGGVFAPSLFTGAMLGGAVGLAANAVFPDMPAPPGAYALVGMGAVFAGTAHAPITSILILFELTDDYKIILPLMIAVVISHLVASTLSDDSIYTVKLRRRGGLTPPRLPAGVLDHVLVYDAMSPDFRTVPSTMSIQELADVFRSCRDRVVFVLDEDGGLAGVVRRRELENILMTETLEGRDIDEIMSASPMTCTPEQPLRDVLERISRSNLDQIPVVDRTDETKLIGVVGREQLFWAFGELAQEHRGLLKSAGLGLDVGDPDAVQADLEVLSSHRLLCDRRVRDVRVPDRCLIVLVRRAGRGIIPRGNTVLEPGDVLVLLTTRQREPELRRWMSHVGGPSE